MAKRFITLLKNRRKAHGVKRIADDLGVTRQAVYLWLNGTNKTPQPIQRLAQALWKEEV